MEELPIGEYRFYLNECFNINALKLTGEYEFETENEKAARATKDYYERLKSGKW